ncbi:GNAT family N-acetyltransferase [Gorillibacterium timonense]|uniref:GNAT family N-acetyltransferase n=1 Tax=Gorillibacterium timonense TaxID=1689269 RepID=UPI0018FE34E2|nr:GNAT family N-acetyltransferase [Gorillibacterium timonense]
MQDRIHVQQEDPNTLDAKMLMNLLSDTLESITGDSGRSSFDVSDIGVPRSLFVIARNGDGAPIGCGAIRPVDFHRAELKRMYAQSKGNGVGTAILSYLETQAQHLGYSAIWLETRVVNKEAVFFYEKRGITEWKTMENIEIVKSVYVLKKFFLDSRKRTEHDGSRQK